MKVAERLSAATHCTALHTECVYRQCDTDHRLPPRLSHAKTSAGDSANNFNNSCMIIISEQYAAGRATRRGLYRSAQTCRCHRAVVVVVVVVIVLWLPLLLSRCNLSATRREYALAPTPLLPPPPSPSASQADAKYVCTTLRASSPSDQFIICERACARTATQSRQ